MVSALASDVMFLVKLVIQGVHQVVPRIKIKSFNLTLATKH